MEASNFLGGGAKPKLVTLLTSSTGIYIPTADMARCLIFVQAGGAGGHGSVTNFGGGGGQMRQVFRRIPIAGKSWVIGAGGAATQNGSDSRFDNVVAQGGFYGSSTSGTVNLDASSYTSTVQTTSAGGGASYRGSDHVPGGAGGSGASRARAAGHPFGVATSASVNGDSVSGSSAYGGGDSYFGIGGIQGGAGPTGYGSGAASSGVTTGQGGCIEIWDFGA